MKMKMHTTMYDRNVFQLKSLSTAFFIAAILLITSAVIRAQEVQKCEPSDLPEKLMMGEMPEKGILSIHAGSMEYSEKEAMYHVRDHATIKFEHFVIETDHLEINEDTEIARTTGEFEMRSGSIVFAGDSFMYNFRQKRGLLTNVTTLVDGVNFKAKEVEVSPAGTIIMRELIASTCCMQNLEYHIQADRAEIFPGGKAKFKHISFFFKGYRVLKWPSYTTSLLQMGGEDGVGYEGGSWIFSSPSIGYSDIGGLNANTGLEYVHKKIPGTTGLYMNYYADDGVFLAASHKGQVDENVYYSAHFGKKYKENRGYFRYFDPVIVWNGPMLEVGLNNQTTFNKRLEYGGSIEAGRMKESDTPKYLDRFFAYGHARLRLNGEDDPIKLALLGDGRYGVYKIYREYKIWGSGIETSMGDMDKNFLRLQWMWFRYVGTTPFRSDLVNTNDKLFTFSSIKIRPDLNFMIDSQYDLDNDRFDEIVYTLNKQFECIQLNMSWRTERKKVGLSMRITKPGGNGK